MVVFRCWLLGIMVWLLIGVNWFGVLGGWL